MEKVKKAFSERITINEILFLLLIFITPIIFISNSIIDTFSLKTYIVSVFTYLILFIWAVKSLKKDKFIFPTNLISGAVLLVVLVNLFSSILSDNFILSFWGRDFGLDSSVSLITLFILFFVGTFLFQKIKTTSFAYLAFIFSSLITIVFSLIFVFLPNVIPGLGYFFSNTTNTIGRWFDLGIFVGLLMILLLISVEFLKLNKKLKIFAYVTLALAAILQFIIGFSELWFVIGIFSLIFFIYFLVNNKTLESKNNRLPSSSLIVLVISFVVIISGFSLNSRVQNLLEINYTDFRPSITSHYQITKQSIVEKPVLGQGPATFNKSWSKYKPESFNLTELWNSDFRYGYGLIPTYFTSTGVLGIISWLIFFGLFLYYGFVSLFRKIENSFSKYILISSFIGSLYLWVMSFIYVPSVVNVLLTFVFSSVFVASLYREKFISVKEFSVSKNPKYGFLYIFIVVAILISSIMAVYNLSEKIVSNYYSRQGLIALQQNNFQEAERSMLTALSIEQNDNYLRNLSEIQQVIAVQVQNNSQLSDEERSNLFQNYLSSSVQSASAAVEYDPQNYNNFVYLGNLFTDLVSLEIEGVEQRAIEFLEEAKRLSPKNPSIPISLARIYIAMEDYDKAKELINEAIEIKSNYTDAVYLLSRINVIEGEIETAIENVRLTTLVRPNDPVTYFQLGLLQYQNGDYSESISSFESAVIRNPFYANAKYFLGLSYYEVGRNQDAVDQFTDLKQLNPDNQEIDFILNNLQQGQSPFAGSGVEEPPIDDEPENREEPPIDEEN